MATCPHCSNEIDDGARFCGVCGRPITQTAADQRAHQMTGPGAPRTLAAPGYPRGSGGVAHPVAFGAPLGGRALADATAGARRRAPLPDASPRRHRRRHPPGRRRGRADPRSRAAAGEPDRPHAEPPLHRRGQDRGRWIRRRVPRQADRHRARGGAEDPAPPQRQRRDHRRPLPARGRGVLEAARSAHGDDLRLRRDAGRHLVPGDGAAARAQPAPATEGRRAAEAGARVAHHGPGAGVAVARRTPTASSTAT